MADPVQTAAPAAEITTRPTQAPKTVTTAAPATTLETLRTAALRAGQVKVAAALATIQTYAKELPAERGFSEKQGGTIQARMYAALATVLNETSGDGQGFTQALSALLEHINTNSKTTEGVFHPRNVLRYSEAQVHQNYITTVTLLVRLANPKGRAAVAKSVDVSKLSSCLNEQTINALRGWLNTIS